MAKIGSESTRAVMPTLASLDSSAYRARHASLPRLPQSRDEIDLPDEFTKTPTGADFLLAAGDDNEYLIFGTVQNLRLMEQHKHWKMDGTFRSSPRLYAQVIFRV